MENVVAKRRIEQLCQYVCKHENSPGRAWCARLDCSHVNQLPAGSYVLKSLDEGCESRILLPQPVTFWEAWDICGCIPSRRSDKCTIWEVDWFSKGKKDGKFKELWHDAELQEDAIPSVNVPYFPGAALHAVKLDQVFELIII